MSESLPSWKSCWRIGFAPRMPAPGLLALRDALRDDDPRLTQGLTTEPPSVSCSELWPCEGACAVAFAGWKGGLGLYSVGDVVEFLGRACDEADRRLGDPKACRWFLEWFDEKPRGEVFPALLEEVERELRRREECCPTTPR